MLLGIEIEQVKAPAILEHNLPGADARKMDVEILEESDLSEVVLLRVESPEVGALVFVAVGQEIESRAMPHRLGVSGLVMGNIFGFEGFEIEQPDIRVHPAA